MFARIYRPSKSAMQSGKAKTDHWVLDFAPARNGMGTEPLMGWTASRDTLGTQVRMTFETKDAAMAYAKEQGIPFQVTETPERKPVSRAYGDNFAFRRRTPWTH